ncbi:hypothetical protein IMZ11_06145 [Microtetraspora sp. AC03309]|uniref:hypothetical protein n=1 Tax=Microtetraspora sp. AC03309 TaxID=2779376 RepID=UPI001E4514BF|nr:hypothetical protein [Microtetraspora sp. AC03309]MCC5575221.1 hypothetical protein [Microtetraspora sp. AC03309]
MKLRVGQTLKSLVDTTGLVVVRCTDQDLSVTCGGHEMSPDAPGERVPAVGGPNGSGLQLGKRYTVDGTDVELLCVQGGEHSVAVDGTEVVQKSAKPLPASD